jgi:tetratricopeptide (TPR) repeat protein
MNQAWQKADELNSASAAAMTAAQACYCHAFLWNPSECEEWALRELSRPRLAHARSLRQRFFHQLAHAYVFAGTLNETRRLLVETPCLLAEANLAFYAGDWSQAESTLLRDLEEQGRRPGRPKQESFAMLWLGRLHHARSEYLGAENLLRQALAIVRGQHLYIEVDIRSELTALYVDSARANDAKSQLARCREILGNGEDWRGLTGKVARAEAIVAAADGKYEDAELQFEKSVQIFRRCHVPFEEAEALHYWGRALDASGDHGRANEKLDAAIEIYRRCGAGKRWVERVEVDRPAAPSRTDYGGQQIDQLSVAGQFRKQGHYWTVSFVGETFRLKDSKSLRVIAHLIRNPGHQFHARELAALDSPQVARRIPHHDENVGATVSTDLGDAGVVLDAQALAEYRHRLADLRPEIEEAESCNDLGRVSLLREEAEVLTAELAAGAGFQGRERRASSHSERARLSVTKNIRGAIEKIREANPVLGRHLANSIKTGYLCSYSPDPANLVLWRS